MFAACPCPQTLEAIAEPTRLALLDAVRDQERSVGELVELVGMHQPGVSRHLRVLRSAGLVDVRRDGQRRCYRARFEPLRELDAWLELHRRAWDAAAGPPRSPPVLHLDRGAPMTSRHGTVTRDGAHGTIDFERRLAHPVGRRVDRDHHTRGAGRLVAAVRRRDHRGPAAWAGSISFSSPSSARSR